MEAFKIKNGITATRYLGSSGADGSGTEAYNLDSASYDSVSFSVSGQVTTPRDIKFNNAGTKMYTVGNTSDSVFQYSLSTAFDLSTASYDSVSFSVSSQDDSPFGILFNNDGTKMYMVGNTGDSVYQYSLSTAFDLSTASYDSVSFDFSTQDATPLGIDFNNDGTKMYMVGNGNDAVYQYSLSTAYDVSTLSYDSVSLDISSQATFPIGIELNNDGTSLYVVDFSSDSIYQYTMSTAFDLSTASYDSISFDFTSQDSKPTGFTFNEVGTKMYMIGETNGAIYQYSTVAYTQTLDLSTGTTFSFTPSGATTVSFTNPPASGNAIGFSVEIIGNGSAITWPASVKWDLATAPVATASKELYTFVTTDGGTTYYGKKAAEGLA